VVGRNLWRALCPTFFRAGSLEQVAKEKAFWWALSLPTEGDSGQTLQPTVGIDLS